MSTLIRGERIGKTAIVRPGADAIIFDESRENVLLTRRSDNKRWCLPGGLMDPGESAHETCIRETLEETGLQVRVTRLVGIYSSPDLIIEYEDGNRQQPISMAFEAEVICGQPRLSDETTDHAYFTIDSLEGLDVMEHHLVRIQDAVINSPGAFMK